MLLMPLLLPGMALADETAPSVLAASCVACHGTGGKSEGAIPTIAGQKAADLQKEMLAFRDGSAKATVMNRIAKGYTDPEIAALAHEIETWTN